jgi:class 3 adenylate cyclase
MISLAPSLWPRWFRITLVGIISAVVIGGGLFSYRYFAKPIVLTVAVGSADGEALSLISAVSARLAATKSHIRLKVVNVGSSAKASEMLSSGNAELAIVRGDTGGLSDARSVLLLTHGVVLIMAPASSSADSLGDLRDTAIGVVGGAINQPVVEALKQVYPLDRAGVRFQDVAIADGAAALSPGKVHALLAVVPLTEKYLAKVKQYFQHDGANLNIEFEREGWPVYRTRCGLHTGEAVVGNIGSEDRMNYTALGATVNLAARLEGLNKNYGTSILVSSVLRQRAESGFVFRSVDRISPKGFAEAFEIYELRCKRADDDVADTELCREWEVVYAVLRNGPLAEAERELTAFLAKYPSDGVARYHQLSPARHEATADT